MMNNHKKAHGAHTNTVCSKQGVKSGSTVYQVSFASYCTERIDYKTELYFSFMTNGNGLKVSHYNRIFYNLPKISNHKTHPLDEYCRWPSLLIQ